jgi:hypothetical protein
LNQVNHPSNFYVFNAGTRMWATIATQCARKAIPTMYGDSDTVDEVSEKILFKPMDFRSACDYAACVEVAIVEFVTVYDRDGARREAGSVVRSQEAE